ncbi:Alpha/Beta hydrolase protein [Chytriomyces sp. MP71]|nr:Alpha/Beta hydrolase protein [Chytriomyces sp. MP71]
MRSLALLLVLLLGLIQPAFSSMDWSVPEETIDRLKMYTRFARIAYEHPDNITSWACEQCSHHLVSHVAKDQTTVIEAAPGTLFMHQSYVTVSHQLKQIIVTISGSNSVGDWLSDLAIGSTDFLPNSTQLSHAIESHVARQRSLLERADLLLQNVLQYMVDWIRVDDGEILVHSGFQGEWSLLKANLVPILHKLTIKFPTYDVTFVGHSLGGAVALLGATDLVHEGPLPGPKVRVFTQGQPRVGNHAFRKFVQKLRLKEVARVVNYGDPIPHFGLQTWGFRHVMGEYWIKLDGTLQSCDDSDEHDGEDTICQNSLEPIGSIESHTHYFNWINGEPHPDFIKVPSIGDHTEL